MKFLRGVFKFFAYLFLFGLIISILGAGGVVYGLYHFGRGLPDYRQLADYQPPVMTRIHAGDGRLIAEYATEKRVFVPVNAIPRRVINAFLSAEDKSFYEHYGVNPLAIARAVVTNLKNMGSKRPIGASTITQQVAKNFLLTNEVSVTRKVKEAILAFRIEKALTKDRILELYLNEIYLGISSYGVAAASFNYFGKALDELTIAECAFLAALPKAPNSYHPQRHSEAARIRRDWVVDRMLEDRVVTSQQGIEAKSQPIIIRSRADAEFVRGADYFAEDIRRDLVKRYGEEVLYKGGLLVRTSLDPRLQEIADRALRAGLIEYDIRHGWRGPEAELGHDADWMAKFAKMQKPLGIEPWEMAIVISMDAKFVEILFQDGRKGRIPLAEMLWAKPTLEDQKVGPTPKQPAEVLTPGFVIVVELVSKNDKGVTYPPATYALRQIPKVEGALIALDPHTGRVLAMSGGYSFARSQFNRVTQAMRQPGSSFKPILYLAALDEGYTPSSLILDAPFVIEQGPGLPKWRPENYTSEFYGPSTMRLGIEKSRNLMTVRLAQALGMDKVAEYANRLGVAKNMPKLLASSLGSIEATPMAMTAAYAVFVNGGKRINPTLIDRIQDRDGRTVFRHDNRACNGCSGIIWANTLPPNPPDNRERLTSSASAYQMVSMLQGVVERGTATSVHAVGKPLAGKTGTSNDFKDAWFIGFSPDLAVGVFVGFDGPQSLGKKETGGAVAAPIFRDFMKDALAGVEAKPFRVPPDIRLVRVNLRSGKPAKPGEKDVIWEAFKPDNVPGEGARVIEGLGASDDLDSTPSEAGGTSSAIPGSGGLY